MVFEIDSNNKSEYLKKSKDTPKKLVLQPSLNNPGYWRPEDPERRKKEILNLKEAGRFENYWIPLLNEAINKRDFHALELLFVEWGIKKGFSKAWLMNWAGKDYLNFALVIYNIYLGLIPGCSGKFRQSKFKSKIPKSFLFNKSPEFIHTVKKFELSFFEDLEGSSI